MLCINLTIMIVLPHCRGKPLMILSILPKYGGIRLQKVIMYKCHTHQTQSLQESSEKTCSDSNEAGAEGSTGSGGDGRGGGSSRSGGRHGASRV